MRSFLCCILLATLGANALGTNGSLRASRLSSALRSGGEAWPEAPGGGDREVPGASNVPGAVTSGELNTNSESFERDLELGWKIWLVLSDSDCPYYRPSVDRMKKMAKRFAFQGVKVYHLELSTVRNPERFHPRRNYITNGLLEPGPTRGVYKFFSADKYIMEPKAVEDFVEEDYLTSSNWSL